MLTRTQIGADVTALFDQYGAPGQRIVGVVNVPIVSNVLGLRVAADIDHEGGWIDQPAANQKNINGTDLGDVRIEALLRPGADFSISAMQVIHRATEGTLTGEDAQGDYTQVFGQTTKPSIADDYDVSDLTVQWQGQGIRVLNTLARFTHDLRSQDTGNAFQLTPPPSPLFDEYVPEYTNRR